MTDEARNTPAVSVVIPCYNRQSSLRAAIESALAQTAAVDEVIVVDDGSADQSALVARECGDRVRVISTPNRGAAAARNRGIREARGEWIAFLDSDDRWAPDKLQWQLRAASVYPQTQLIFCDTTVVTGSTVHVASRFALGGLYGHQCASEGPLASYDRRLFLHMLGQSRVITSAVMVRRDLPELNFPEHIWGSEDWALWLRLAARYPFASVDRVLVQMTRGGDNLTGNVGRLLRNDVRTLEDLQQDPILTDVERTAVARQLAEKRVAAMYHSLVRGETAEARKLLSAVDARYLGRARRSVYWLASRLPARWVRALADLRLGHKPRPQWTAQS